MSNANVIEPSNPANEGTAPTKAQRRRIPMSVPTRKLEVPDLPGYHLHWILESNIPRALAAFYDFVDRNEVPLHNHDIAGDSLQDGNRDLGSRVSIPAGVNAQGHPETLVLMKLEEHYWREDQQEISRSNAARLGAIFRGEQIITQDGERADDKSLRYVDKERTRAALFQRPSKKAQQ